MPAPSFASRAPEYRALWDGMTINKGHAVAVLATARKIAKHREDYESVSRETGVPWYVVGIIHAMECTDFPAMTQHLHNGDPLTARTKLNPSGRPKAGNPPFTWVESAIDALRYDKLDKVTDWSIEQMCWTLEFYNGPGYARRGTPSPYLWSFTNQYDRGKFVEVWDDTKRKFVGVYNPQLVSEQAGAMALLRALIENGDVTLDKPAVAAETHPWPVAEDAKPSLVGVAWRSKSIKLQTQGFLVVLIEWLFGGISWFVSFVSGLLGIIPASMSDIQTVANSGSQLAGYLQINAGKIVFPLVLATLAVGMYRHLFNKQELEELRGPDQKEIK